MDGKAEAASDSARSPRAEGATVTGRALGVTFGLAGAVIAAITVVLPACVAASHAGNVADAAHDEAVVRAIGLGWTGVWRAFDAPVASLFAWLPLGTRAFRAALGCAAACGIAGGALYMTTHALLRACAGEASRLAVLIAAIASLTATLAAGWQIEAQAAGGAVVGGLLALLPLAIALTEDRVHSARISRAPWAAMACGAALAYEPLVGAAAIASLGAGWIAGEARASWKARIDSKAARVRIAVIAAAFAAGTAPLWLGLSAMHRRAGVALADSVLAAPLGERGESGPGVLLLVARDDLGWLTCALAIAGAIVALRSARGRSLGAALLAVVGIGLLAMSLGASAGDTRYGAPVLAAMAATCALAGVGMHAVVRAVAAARVPFASASAAMIVVLEMTFPARAADDALLRCDERTRGVASTWDEAAWGPLPAGAVVLVSDRRVLARMLAARASGALRGDLAIVPTFHLAGPLAMRELTREPKLSPFWRDMALLSAPDEHSLSTVAAARPLVMPFEPRWDRTLARHLVPAGLFARFEDEPRGTSDRRKALDAFTPSRERLARAITSPRDPELLAATGTLLRARALGLAASGDRDLLAHALDDLRPFSPADPIAAELVKRVIASRGVIDVKDLAP